MLPSPKIALAATLACFALLAGCSIMTARPDGIPKLRVEQGSFRMTKEIDADGSISLTENTQLLGSIEGGAILEAEGQDVSTVQVLFHEGRYYIVADGFRNLWQVTPEPGTGWATYRPITLPDHQTENVRISRYGPPERICVRVDVDGGGPWYVNGTGGLQDECQ
jgi:hypothetical protein